MSTEPYLLNFHTNMVTTYGPWADLIPKVLRFSPMFLQPFHLLQQSQRPSVTKEIVDHDMPVPCELSSPFWGQFVGEAT